MISPHEQPVVQWGGTEPNNNYYANYYNPQCYVLPNHHHQQSIQSPDANSPYLQPTVQQPTTHLHPAESALPYYNYNEHLVPSPYMPPTSIAYRPRKFYFRITQAKIIIKKCRLVFKFTAPPSISKSYSPLIETTEILLTQRYAEVSISLYIFVPKTSSTIIITFYFLALSVLLQLTAIVNKFGNNAFCVSFIT